MESTHCLVFWKDEQRYTTVKISHVNADGSQIQEDKMYLVKWNSKQEFDATIIAIGTKIHCDDEREECIQAAKEENNLRKKDDKAKEQVSGQICKKAKLSDKVLEGNLNNFFFILIKLLF